MRVAIVVMSLLLALGIAVAQDNATDEPEKTVLEVIYPQHIDAATVVQLFGGSIVGRGMGYLPLQGGVGTINPGAGIGGLYGPPTGGYGYTRLGQQQGGNPYGYPYSAGPGYNPGATGPYRPGYQGGTGYDVGVWPQQQR